MSSETLEQAAALSAEQALLEAARAQARADQLPYAGRLAPRDAWRLVQAGAALLVDVRSAEERHFVGQVPGSVPVPWAMGTALTRNPRFVKELEARAGKAGKPLLLLCRSGKRSAAAAEAASKAGLADVFNVLEGFEGELDDAAQRGHFNGWRFHGLPWTQD
jgi:rhodanese-related sulfurtransferase